MNSLDRRSNLTKMILLISAQSLLCMITTARDLPIIPWMIGILLFGACLYRIPVRHLSVFQERIHPEILLCSGFLSIELGYTFFYETWLYSEVFQNISHLLSVPNKLLVLSFSGCLIAGSIPFLYCVCYYLWQGTKQILQNNDDGTGRVSLKHSFFVLLFIYSIGIITIIRANYNYIDDFGRVTYGYKEWNFFSRYLSVGLSTFLHMGSYLTDVSPLPQLVCAAILAASAILVLTAVLNRTSFSVWELIAMVPLGLNPYFLECFSYKYDAPYMALSILGMVFPLLFRKKNTLLYALSVIFGTLIMCTTYQAASGIFPMLVVYIAFQDWERGDRLRKQLHHCFLSALYYGTGLVIFRCFILRPEKTYAGTISTSASVIPTFLTNIQKYYQLVALDLKPLWLLLIILLAGFFLLSPALIRKTLKPSTFIIRIISLGLLFLLAFGVYPALQDASFDPRAMYGFGFLLTLLTLHAATYNSRLCSKLLAAMLSWSFFVFCFTYGNALNLQKDYTTFRIQTAIEDVNDLDIFRADHPIRLEVSGSIGYAPAIRNMPQNDQILNRLVPITFRGGWMWGEYELHHFYDLENVQWDECRITPEDQFTQVEEKMYHTIRINDDCVQIDLK